MYTNDEKTDMILIFGECRKNANAAAQLYRERYPNRLAPTDKIFRRLEAKLRSDWPKTKRPRVRTATGEANEIAVIEAITENPHIGQNTIARNLGISQASVSKIINANKFHPYHIQLVHDLKPTDYPKRLEFCNFVRQRLEADENFLNLVLFSDEAKFSNNGGVNKHNCHYYALENPHWIRMGHFQNVISTNVWCGILGERIIGPYFFRGTLTGLRYLAFLNDILPQLLEEIELGIREEMWFQQDGAPPHYHREVRTFLNNNFGERWIGRGAVSPWPARSPDLTPLDYFLWGAVKEEVYQTPIENLDQLEQRIRAACNRISPEILRRVKRSFMNRINACERSGGAHFEQFLH